MTVPILRSKLPKIRWNSKTAAVTVEGLDLGLDSTFLSNWTITAPAGFGPAGDPNNSGWWVANPGNVHVGASALFFWLPEAAPFMRESTATRTISGLTPLAEYGISLNFNWLVHVAWGKFQVILNGKTYEMPTLGNNLWNLGDVDTVFNRYLRSSADALGDLTIQLRFYEFRPSFNVQIFLSQGSVAELGPSDLLFVMPPEKLDVFPKYIEPQLRSLLPSGFRDGWEADPCDVLSCQVKAIPGTGGLSDGTAWWGWDGGGGWGRFLEFASVGNSFLYFPDQEDEDTSYECVLVDSAVPKPDKDWVGHQQLELQIRTVADTPIIGY